ncbi:MAG: 2Fe-2S iron-sulfur cluster binding domain-containing protein [Spirochaetia bacterium]|nr:2Fe-2S iron-sulfur cluster binding domain-containing protein [Spirochaetia bacterium]
MFSLFKTTQSELRARIEPAGIELTLKPDQSILESALSADILYPHNCRVGSCTSCKSRLLSGKIKELSDTGYVLSEEEIQAGMILACQSIPLTNLTLQVELD